MPSPSRQTASDDLVKSGFGSIKWLFFLQIGSRLITFGLNTAIARTVPQSTFAIANLQIQLLLNIILPLSREAFRRAILRAPLDPHADDYRLRSEKLLNFSYLSLPLGVLLSVVITVGFLLTSTFEELRTPGYREAIQWVGVAGLVEMLSEPLYIIAQHRLMFGVRAAIELVGIALKSLFSFLLVVHFGMGLQAFGVVTLIYCSVVSLGYWLYFGLLSPLPEFPTISSLLPHRIAVKDRSDTARGVTITRLSWSESLDVDLSRYLATFEWQTLQKMLLQEGEKILLRGAETLDNQGIFALVNVLGSLVVRFVFAWLEEGLFPLFSKLLVQALALPEDDPTRRNLLRKSSVILVLLSKLMCYIGLLFACFGPAYSYLLLDLLYTSKYSQTTAPQFLAWYCVYILAMALNGITEAFAHSAASTRVLNYFNIAMVAQSLLLVAATLVFLHFGFAAAVIMSNCLVMATRIVLSIGFIKGFFNDNLKTTQLKNEARMTTKTMRTTSEATEKTPQFLISSLFPHPIILTTFAISYIVTRISESNLCSIETGTSIVGCGQHISVAIFCLLLNAASAIWIERPYFKSLYQFVRTRDV